jgi:hypothetical protein
MATNAAEMRRWSSGHLAIPSLRSAHARQRFGCTKKPNEAAAPPHLTLDASTATVERERERENRRVGVRHHWPLTHFYPSSLSGIYALIVEP